MGSSQFEEEEKAESLQCQQQESTKVNSAANPLHETLTVVYQNVQGLESKLAEIEVLLTDYLKDINILCISEHWVKEMQASSIIIPDFEMISKFCRINYKGGGTCIYVRTGVESKEIKCKRKCIEKDFEYSICELTKLKITIVCLYRSALGNFAIFMENLEGLLNELKHKVIVLGDFNVNFKNDCSKQQQLCNLFLCHNMMTTVNEVTRCRNMSETIIDQVFINNDKCEYNTEVIDTGFSDHKGIKLSLNVTSYKDRVINNNYRERRFINDDSIRIFNCILENNNWGSESSGDVNTKFDSFLESYKHCFDVAFPIKRVKTKHKTKTWVTQEIRKSSDTLRKLNKSARKNVALKAHVKCYRSLYKKVIIAAKKFDNDSYIEKGNNKMKSTWEVINKNIGRHKRKDNSFVIKSGGKTVKDPLQIANIFNKHFTNIAINLIKTKCNSNSKVKIPMNDMTMFLYPVTE
ncbi:uncharacterized protein LOC126251978 [Schistocerca nitens]|uniref:uncharacterized protein LOC126251978 n=1 Tax=Schistocerca nitens TaxID=7011 RepID=UPI002117FCB5|nr:uncharacterized protein LOC126251978 [Schistocerca nitens]